MTGPTTRLALNRLRQLKSRRETYIGPWLPEPVSNDPRGDGAAAAELADEVSMAKLIVLESLSPLERAAFVLTDVFGMPSSNVGQAHKRSPVAVRQLVHRARSHVEARRPNGAVDSRRHRQVTERFLAAAGTGEIEALLAALSPEVTLVTDGDGIRKAALRPIHGATHVRSVVAVSAALWLTGNQTPPPPSTGIPTSTSTRSFGAPGGSTASGYALTVVPTTPS